MPVARYTVMDGDGRPVGTEDLRCAPGPAGWRSFSTIETVDPEPHREVVDLAVDARWRPVRIRIDTEAHRLILMAEGDRLVGRRDGDAVDLALPPATELDYLSPAFNAVTANRLTASAEIDSLYIAPYTLERSTQRQRYELLGNDEVATPVGRFVASRWRFTAVAQGWTRDLWVAGDVVVAYEGLFELAEYEPGPRGPFPLG
ncbi:MAG TPA: putative glycolipid-binding domain-containing protein [Actinomycetota bacterium]|nr:putative glycolipid-binding domain-containing protein [Actinomycetota bacterium]